MNTLSSRCMLKKIHEAIDKAEQDSEVDYVGTHKNNAETQSVGKKYVYEYPEIPSRKLVRLPSGAIIDRWAVGYIGTVKNDLGLPYQTVVIDGCDIKMALPDAQYLMKFLAQEPIP